MGSRRGCSARRRRRTRTSARDTVAGMFIDSHAHIDTPEFDADRADVLARARAAGVHTIVCVGAADNLDAARRAVELAERQPDVYATVGIHPHHAGIMQSSWWSQLEQLCAHPKVVAVGETGLDYYYNTSEPAAQRDVFIGFIELARRVSLPLICHIRDAHGDAQRMLADHRAAELGCVIHCFTGTPEDAALYVDMGMYVSFSGIVTFKGKRSEPLRLAVERVPAHRLLIETDCPYLAPTPKRGKRNEPAFVVHTAAVVAERSGLSVEQLAQATTENARRLFRLPA